MSEKEAEDNRIFEEEKNMILAEIKAEEERLSKETKKLENYEEEKK